MAESVAIYNISSNVARFLVYKAKKGNFLIRTIITLMTNRGIWFSGRDNFYDT